MTTSELGPVVLDVKGQSLEPSEVDILSSPLVGGVILFARNYRDPQQLAELVEELRNVRPDLVLAVDQEGGRVQRFRQGFTRLPPMQALGNLCRDEPELGLQLSRDCGWLMAAELVSLGIDISFAPVLDLDEHYSTIIGDRAFGREPNLVIQAAGAFMEGMHEAGMATTGKHFPGHGSVREDSHLELPVDRRDFSEVNEHDLRPFRQLVKDLDAVMPAHMLFPAIDDQPVGFSQFWLQQVLRQDLGFEGVIFSDDLTMAGAAAAGDCLARADLALGAGCDSVLICNSPAEAASVVRHLEQEGQPLSTRLGRMRASNSATGRAQLLSSERYQETRTRISALVKE